VIEFDCDLSNSTVSRVDIEFDAPSDLAATRIDRYHTGDMALRDFRNGYLVWNTYIHTAILGSGFSWPHGPGCVVDLHVTDLDTGLAHTVDCMERVAVHVDDIADNDGSGTYPSNIKWSGDALSWLESADLGSFVFRFASGGDYGLQDVVAVERRIEFFGESRYFHHSYLIRNIDSVTHDFDFVWGREQWLYGSAPGSNRQNGDRGMLPNDPTAYGGEHRFGPTQVDGNWFAAFDRSSFYSISVILPHSTDEALPTYAYFLCNPALGNFTGEYPIVPSGSCSDMPNLFFEKQLGMLAPGDSIAYEFYQWGGYGSDREELTEILWEDADAVSEGSTAAEHLTGDDPSAWDGSTPLTIRPNPLRASCEIAFELPRSAHASLAVHDAQGRLVAVLVEDFLSAGHHSATWRGKDRRGLNLPAGVYFLRLSVAGQQEVRKVVIQR
jgi:hypothetical protein